MEKNKNLKKAEEFFKSLENENGTSLSIFSCDEEDAVRVACVGDEMKIMHGVYNLIRDGLHEKAVGLVFISTVSAAMKLILEGGGKDAERLKNVIGVIEDGDIKLSGFACGCDFNTNKDTCVRCDDFAYCLQKKLDESGVDLDVVKKRHRKKRNG